MAGVGLLIAAMFVVPIIADVLREDEPSFGVTAPEADGRAGIGFVDESGLFGGLESDKLTRYGSVPEGLEAKGRGDIETLYVVPVDYFQSGVVAQYWDFAGRFAFNGEAEGRLRAALTAHLLAAGEVDPALVTRAVAPAHFQNFRVEDNGEISEPGSVTQSVGNLLLPMMFVVLFMAGVVASTGAMVMSIAEEKENRLVELVITSASPLSIMGGKLAAQAVVGLSQMVVWIVVAFFTFPEMFDRITPGTELAVTASLLITVVLAVVTGYLLTASLSIFVGAVTSSTREASRQAPMIYMLMFVPLWLIGLLINQPDGLIARVLSYIPFSAPTGLLMRFSIGADISGWEIAAALAGVVATTLVMLWVSARVFRAATLMQGQSFSGRNLVAALRGAE